MRGATEGGFEGLLKGAGRGIAGFFVKPITGVLDLAQKTAEAIKARQEAFTETAVTEAGVEVEDCHADAFLSGFVSGRL